MSSHAERISLLYPPHTRPKPSSPGTPNVADLGLTSIVRALDIDQRHHHFISNILTALEDDPAIISYRQDVLQDLLDNPTLVELLTAILPQLRALAEAGPSQRWQEPTPLLLVATRLADLTNYVTCVEALWQALGEASAISAQAWLHLRSALAGIRDDPEYQQLRAGLPELQGQLDRAGSITVGINLDAQLQPEGATILSINHGRFTGKGGVIERLLGDRHASDAVRGITALYKASEVAPRGPEHEFFRDMSRLLERVASPVASALDRYTRVNGTMLTAIEPELILYLGAVRLTNKIRAAGLPLCRVEIASIEEQVCIIKGNYSLDLALRAQHSPPGATRKIIPNDVEFNISTRITILTGPNSGGKTTYARSIGQAHILFQAGLLVPGEQARISPVDGIYTHFATAERPSGNGGRLAEELERMSSIFSTATSASLLLFNEPFTSTDHRSARLIAREIFEGIKLLNARTLYVTHLHELVEDFIPLEYGSSYQQITSATAGSQQSAHGSNQDVPTYQIKKGRPHLSEYARELAGQYGLSSAQLVQSIQERIGNKSDHIDKNVNQ